MISGEPFAANERVGKPGSAGCAIPVAWLSDESCDIADSSGVGVVESAHALTENKSAIAVAAVISFFNFFISLLGGQRLRPLHSL